MNHNDLIARIKREAKRLLKISATMDVPAVGSLAEKAKAAAPARPGSCPDAQLFCVAAQMDGSRHTAIPLEDLKVLALKVADRWVPEKLTNLDGHVGQWWYAKLHELATVIAAMVLQAKPASPHHEAWQLLVNLGDTGEGWGAERSRHLGSLLDAMAAKLGLSLRMGNHGQNEQGGMADKLMRKLV